MRRGLSPLFLSLSLSLYLWVVGLVNAAGPCMLSPTAPFNFSGVVCTMDAGDYYPPYFVAGGTSRIEFLSDLVTGKGVTIYTDYFELSAGSIISSVGYGPGAGPGKGLSYARIGGSASHASRGINNFGNESDTGPYGDFSRPTSLGSGGGFSGYLPVTTPGTGGGAIHIVARIFKNYGTLDVHGNGVGPMGLGMVGGGSGGSIWIECDELISYGAWNFAGGPGASNGRAALYYNTSVDPTIDGVNVPAIAINSDGGGGTMYVEYGTPTKRRALFEFRDPSGIVSEPLQSDYFAATVLPQSTATTFSLDRIHTQGRLAFTGPGDSLVLTISTALTGNGTVFVAGLLDASSSQYILSETGVCFSVLPGATALLAPTLSLSQSKFFSFGTLKLVTDVMLEGPNAQLHLGAEGSTTGNVPGVYTFNSVTANAGASIATTYYDFTNIRGVTIEADSMSLLLGSHVNATGMGYMNGYGRGVGMPCTSDGPPGGGAGHGGLGLSWLKYANFTYLQPQYGLSDYYSLDLMNTSRTWGASYGSYLSPVDVGSGGGRYGYYASLYYEYHANKLPIRAGCSGGGSIHLAIGTLKMTGRSTIQANGVDAFVPMYTTPLNFCGGGSGGSIWLEVGTSMAMSGDSIITADGGGLGAGGRIAIYANANDMDIKDNALVFDLGVSIHALGGSPGTVFLKNEADAVLLIQNNDLLPPLPGTFGSEEVSAVVFLVGPDGFPPHRTYITNHGSLTFLPEPPVVFEPSSPDNRLEIDRGGLIHWHGTIDLTTYTSSISPLSVSIAAHESSYVMLGPALFVYTLLIVEGKVSYEASITVDAGGSLQLGCTGFTIGSNDQQGEFKFPTVSVIEGEIVLRPDYHEVHGFIYSHLISDNININNLGSIHSDNMGYRGMRGPLAGPNMLSSGGHAGSGYQPYKLPGGVNGYGDCIYPETMGSGGGNSEATTGSRNYIIPGGAGGGVVRITVGALDNSGRISAVGQAYGFADLERTQPYELNSGAGGSVWISCSGSCTVQDTSASIYSVDGVFSTTHGSAGGRLSLPWTPSGTMTARGGTKAAYGTIHYEDYGVPVLSAIGDPQTIHGGSPVVVVGSVDFYQFSTVNRRWRINNTAIEIPALSYIDFYYIDLPITGITTNDLYVSGVVTNPRFNAEFQTIHVRIGGTIEVVPGVHIFAPYTVEIRGWISGASNVTIDDGATFVLAASGSTYTSPRGQFRLDILTVAGTLKMPADVSDPYGIGTGVTLFVSDIITIPITGTIHADYLGNAAGQGASPARLNGWCTAAHASVSSCDSEGQDAAYGDIIEPIAVGSGGIEIGNWINSNGGGAIHIIVTTLQLQGNISVKGGALASAGSIWLEPGAFSGAGLLYACGDTYDTYPRSNGRIAVKAQVNSFSGSMCAGTAYVTAVSPSTSNLHIEPTPIQPILPVDLRTFKQKTVKIRNMYYPASNFTVINFVEDLVLATNFGGMQTTLRNVESFSCTNLDAQRLVNWGEINVLGTVNANSEGEIENYGWIKADTLVIAYGGVMNMHSNAVYAESDWSMTTSHRPNVVTATQITVYGTVYFKAPSGGGLFTKPVLIGFEVFLYGDVYADGEGEKTSDFECVGGANAGKGGGKNERAAISDDVFNPSAYGQSGGICIDDFLPFSPPLISPAVGGGAVHIVGVKIDVTGTISANGNIGGAGGSVWIQSSHLTISGEIFAQGNGNITECGGGGRIFYSATNGIASDTSLLHVDAVGCAPSAVYKSTNGTINSHISMPLVVVNGRVYMESIETVLQFDSIKEVNGSNGVVRDLYAPPYWTFDSVASPSFRSDPNDYPYYFNVMRIDEGDSVVLKYILNAYVFLNAGSSGLQLEFQGAFYNWDSFPTPATTLIHIKKNATGPTVVTWDTAPLQFINVSVDNVIAPLDVRSTGLSERASLRIPRFNHSAAFYIRLRKTIPIVSVDMASQNYPFADSIIRINGTGFGAIPNAVVINNDEIGPILYWSDTYIEVVGPGTPISGYIYVVHAQGYSNNNNQYFYAAPGITLPSAFPACSVYSTSHFTQHRSAKFDFNLPGEYILSKYQSSVVEIQVRLEYCGSNPQATCVTAAVVRTPAGTFGFYLNTEPGQAPVLYFNGTIASPAQLKPYVPSSLGAYFYPIFESAPANLTFRPIPAQYTLAFAGGSVEIISGPGWLGVTAYVSDSLMQNDARGICSNLDFSQWRLGDDTLVPITYNQRNINTFMASWRIKPMTSLFAYTAARTFSYYNPAIVSFPDVHYPSDISTPVYQACLPLIQGDMFTTCISSNFPAYSYYSACIQDVANGGSADASITTFTRACRGGEVSAFVIPTVASLSYAFGGGLGPRIRAQEAQTFYVYVYNAMGDLQDDDIFGVSTGFSVTSSHTGLGRYTLSYTAPLAGTYNISTVTMSGRHIQGSPFTVNAIEGQNAVECKIWGDPRVSTFNGFTFSTQGFNEYTFAKVGDLVVQVRQAACGYYATCVTGVAVANLEVGTVIEVYPGTTSLFLIFANLQTVYLPYTVGPNISLRLSYELVIDYDNVQITIKSYGDWFDLTVSVEPAAQPSISDQSVCGVANNALVSQYGSVLPSNPSVSDYHFYAQSWVILAPLFNYIVTGTSHAAQNQNDYPGVYVHPFLSNYERSLAEEKCSPLYDSPLVDVCESYLSPKFYYEACMDDAAARRGYGFAITQSSIVAYIEACNRLSGISQGFMIIPAHCAADGPGLHDNQLKGTLPTYFNVVGRDATGNIVPLSKNDVTVTVTAPMNIANLHIIQSSTNVTVLFNYPTNGTYEVNVAVNGLPVGGSPFIVHVYPFNECSVAGVCDPNANCTNTEIGYTCECATGYIGNGQDCYYALDVTTCAVWGQSHIRSFFGDSFDSLGYKEYRLLTIPSEDITIQTRQEPCALGSTCVTGLAAIVEARNIQIYSINGLLVTYVNSEPTDYLSDPYLILEAKLNQVKIIRPGVIQVDVYMHARYLDITIVLFNKSLTTNGLCQHSSTRRRVYDDESLELVDSIYNYALTQSSYSAQNHPDYEPFTNGTVINPSILANATSLCEQLLEGGLYESCASSIDSLPFVDTCMYDIGRTQDLSSFQAAIATYASLCQLLNNSVTGAPIIGSSCSVYGLEEANEPNTFLITPRDSLNIAVHNPNLWFTVEIMSGPDQFSFVNAVYNPNGTYTERFGLFVGGQYTIKVALFGFQEVYGSPFTVMLSGATPTPPPTSGPTPTPTLPPSNPRENAPCVLWGGSHVTLFSGETITYNGFSEYLLATVGTIQVQVRQAPCGINNASCISAVAVKFDSTVVEFYSINKTLTTYVNSTPTALPRIISPTVLITNTIFSVYISLPHLYIEVRAYSGKLEVMVSAELNNTVPLLPLYGGLCGSLSTSLDTSNATIVRQYAQSWSVLNGSSLFDYNITNTAYGQHNRPEYTNTNSFPIISSQLLQQANTTCSTLVQGPLAQYCNALVPVSAFYKGCLMDVGAHGTVASADFSIIAYVLLCNEYVNLGAPPVVAVHTVASGPGLVSATAGKPTWLVITPRDALGNYPDTTATFTVSFTGPMTIYPITVPFNYSSPSYNVSYTPLLAGSYNVIVTLQDGGQIVNSPYSIVVAADTTCNCAAGFTCLNGTCQDQNECLLTSAVCTPDKLCYNTPGSYVCQGCDSTCNSPHGSCVLGVCKCVGNYTGPKCEANSSPVDYNFNDTSPGVVITPVDNNSSVTFKISITEIRELRQDNSLVRAIQFSSLNFTSSKKDNYTYGYNATFPFTGQLAINFSTTPYARTFTFADQTVELVPNALKFSVKISAWPFDNARNRLVLVSKSNIEAPPDPCYDVSNNIKTLNDSLVWVTSEFAGVTLYGRFLQKSLLDGKAVVTTNTYNGSSGEAYINIPHFFDYSLIDPDFSVLLDPDSDKKVKPGAPDYCYGAIKSGKKTKKAVIATTVVIISVAAMVAIGFVIYKRRQRYNTRQRIQAAHSASSLNKSHSTASLGDGPKSPKTSLLRRYLPSYFTNRFLRTPLQEQHSMNPLYTDEKL